MLTCAAVTYDFLQMIELYRDFSGEVDISSRPKTSDGKSAVIANVLSSTEDENKIAELRKTIASLKSQIKVIKCIASRILMVLLPSEYLQ